VATDVAARGIDVEDISHVIHMNMPDEMEFYTHRSGRTARAGKKGISIAMISRKELGRIKQIEKTLKAPFKRLMVPSGSEVCQKQLIALMHKVREVKINEDEIGEFLPAVMEELKDLTKQDLIKRFASIEFNRFLDYYRNAPDLNKDDKRSGEGEGDRYMTGSRFFINLGKMDGLDNTSLLRFVQDVTGIDKNTIGKVELKGAYSFFEVEKDRTDTVLQAFNGVEYKSRQVRVEVTERRTSSSRGESSERSFRRGRPERSFKSGSDFKKSGSDFKKKKRY
jgi:ATP-dependent RNA helicase DeaD